MPASSSAPQSWRVHLRLPSLRNLAAGHGYALWSHVRAAPAGAASTRAHARTGLAEAIGRPHSEAHPIPSHPMPRPNPVRRAQCLTYPCPTCGCARPRTNRDLLALLLRWSRAAAPGLRATPAAIALPHILHLPWSRCHLVSVIH